MSSNSQRLIRRQYLRNAEGYLELATVFDDRWTLPQEMRFMLANQAMVCLSQVTDHAVGNSQPDANELADVRFLRALSFELLEAYENAAEEFTHSLEIERLQVEAYSHLAWCYRQLQKWDLAVGALTKGLRWFPENAIFYYNAACYSCLAGNFDDSVQYLVQALRLDPSLLHQAETEPDFRAMRSNPRFRAILQQTV